MKTVVVSVDSKVAMWVVVTDALSVVHLADCWACATVGVMVAHSVDLLVASMAVM